MNQFRTVNHISDETAAQAYDILGAHNRQVNPEGKNIYDGDAFKTYYVISVTGNRRSYYTLYQHYNVNANQFSQKDHYVCNLSTDLIEAVSKICTGKGLPVVLYINDNFNPERIPATYFPIGKYKGQSLADVYDIDPNYIIWASFNLSVKKNNKKIEMMYQALNHLRDAHFQMITEKNLNTSTSEYIGTINNRITTDATIIKKFRQQPTDFQPQPNTKYTATDKDGNRIQFYTKINDLEINSTYSIKGTIKRHFESLGVKTTSMNRIAIL